MKDTFKDIYRKNVPFRSLSRLSQLPGVTLDYSLKENFAEITKAD